MNKLHLSRWKVLIMENCQMITVIKMMKTMWLILIRLRKIVSMIKILRVKFSHSKSLSIKPPNQMTQWYNQWMSRLQGNLLKKEWNHRKKSLKIKRKSWSKIREKRLMIGWIKKCRNRNWRSIRKECRRHRQKKRVRIHFWYQVLKFKSLLVRISKKLKHSGSRGKKASFD